MSDILKERFVLRLSKLQRTLLYGLLNSQLRDPQPGWRDKKTLKELAILKAKVNNLAKQR